MRMPDLTFKPTPAWLRYQREARARQRKDRLSTWCKAVQKRFGAWLYRWRLVLAIALLAVVAAVAYLSEAEAERTAMLATVADAERRAAGFSELALALSRGQRARAVSIRLAADGPDEALVQIDRLRELLLTQRAEGAR